VVPAALLLEAARAGRAIDCAVDGEPGVVDAELLRSLCAASAGNVEPRWTTAA
jgi:hypothetical protein